MSVKKEEVLTAIRRGAELAGCGQFSHKAWLRLGGRFLELRFESGLLKEKLLLSVARLVCGQPEQSDAVINVWQERLDGKYPAFCRPLLDGMLWRGGSLFFKEELEIPFLYDGANRYFTAFDEEAGQGFYCLDNASELPFLHICHPFRQLLHWWSLLTTDCLLTHAAVVGVDGKGVGLVGAGGRGKSTTAIASMVRGLEFVGDDYVFFNETAKKARLVYSTGYLNPDMIARMPEFKERIIGSDPARRDKTLVDLSAYVSAFVPELEVFALLNPVLGSDKSNITPALQPLRVTTALAVSTTIQNEGWMSPPVLRRVFACIKGLPVYDFALTPDFEENTECLRNFILTRSDGKCTK
ncbi:MAG: hypothetical protein PHQ31_08555 [Acidaminococcaceae bacterium]|nr:hypothetical protein [Acidaminococcaceae bacterium]